MRPAVAGLRPWDPNASGLIVVGRSSTLGRHATAGSSNGRISAQCDLQGRPNHGTRSVCAALQCVADLYRSSSFNNAANNASGSTGFATEAFMPTRGPRHQSRPRRIAGGTARARLAATTLAGSRHAGISREGVQEGVGHQRRRCGRRHGPSLRVIEGCTTHSGVPACPRRLSFDPPCRLNFDPGSGADPVRVGGG